ncbi:MAG TPA: hypothetical protein VJ783_30795 [Pirellulales bacterium]|nr:hypothetical protein [Pirellulales bacterium]
MPNRRFDWHEHIKDVEKEYHAVRAALDRLKDQLIATPEILTRDETTRTYLRRADRNLEGTYLVRLFAAFEAALRSYDRARHLDPTRDQPASVLIDATGGRRGQGISAAVRKGAHDVRLLRNYWAHESDERPPGLTITQARARLQTYLSWLPDEWD